MDINIKVVSAFDMKKKASSHFYVAQVHEEDADSVKTLKLKENTFAMKNRQVAESVGASQLEAFVTELKEEFDIRNIEISAHSNALENKWFKKNNKHENVKFKIKYDAKYFMAMTQKLFSNLFNAKPEELVNLNKAPKPNQIHKTPSELSFQDLDSFVNKLSEKEKVIEDIFNKRVLENVNLEKCFINFAFTQDTDRKRYGFGLEIYSNMDNLRRGFDPVFRQQLIGHGEQTEGIERLLKSVFDKSNKLSQSGKLVTLNVATPNRTLAGKFYQQQERGCLNKDIEISKVRSKFHDRVEHFTGKLIETDVKLHLEKMKDPNTVSIWTDGSVNQKENYSGTGILIKHQGEKEEISLSNETGTDNTYAEFRGVYESLKKVVTEEKYKGKKVIIISDNDSMSASIRKRLKGEDCPDQPYLEDICTLFKHFDIDVNFHNVKSHVHEKIKAEDKDKLYDFHYNNIVDDLARVGAGLPTKEEYNKSRNKIKKERKIANREKRRKIS